MERDPAARAFSAAFSRYLAAVTISSLGDWLSYVGMTALAASGPMRGISVAAVALAQTIPRAALSPVAGWLADRVDRRALLASAELLRGLAVIGMAWAAARENILLVHVMHFARAGIGAVSDTAGRAALPSWVESREVPRANRALGVVWSLTFVFGIAAGGAVAARFGVTCAFAVDAASFFLAAMLVASLPSARARSIEISKRVSILTLLGKNRPIRAAALLRTPLAVLHGAAFVLSALHFGEEARVVATDLALIHGARAIGNVAGTRVALGSFWRKAATPVGAFGAVLAMFPGGGELGAIVGAGLWGLGMGANWNLATTTMQTKAPPDLLGSVIALDAFSFTMAWATGAAIVIACGAVSNLTILASVAVSALFALVVSRLARGESA